MKADAIGLDEVVAIGYGTQKKVDLTGAVSSVNADKLENIPTPSINRALQGQASGVFISSNDGSPGGGTTVRIRGYGSLQSGNGLL
ncbi:MAG: TonB-dependent receptor plug domain-containing protein [Bacteroidales bacterium]